MTVRLIEPLYPVGKLCAGFCCYALVPEKMQPGGPAVYCQCVFRTLKGIRLHLLRVHGIALQPELAFSLKEEHEHSGASAT